MALETVDTLLFVDIIQSSGAIEMSNFNYDDNVSTAVYQGSNGKHIILDLSEEFIDSRTGAHYLQQLGLVNLVDLVFPNYIKGLTGEREGGINAS